MLALVVAILAMVIVNLFIGSVEIPVGDICRILIGQGSESEIWTNIILSSRLPQVLTAIVAGAGLAVSGLMMQTIFHNPLAGPSSWASPMAPAWVSPSSCCCRGSWAVWH